MLEQGKDKISYEETARRRKIIKFTFILFIISTSLLILYYSPLSLFFPWSPFFKFIFEFFYFPFFIFQPELAFKIYIISTGMGAAYNPITCPVAIFVSLLFMYSITKLMFFIANKQKSKFVLDIIFIVFFTILFLTGAIVTKTNQQKCEQKKDANKHWTARQGIIQISLKDKIIYNFLSKNNRLNLFCKLNNLKYVYSTEGSNIIAVLVNKGSELEKACELEANPQVLDAWPSSLDIYRGAPARREIAKSICDAEGFNYKTIDECEKTINKNISLVDKNYKIAQNDNLDEGNIKKYEDKLISMEFDKNTYETLTAGITEIPRDNSVEKFSYGSYQIAKASSKERLIDQVFQEPSIIISVSASANPNIDALRLELDSKPKLGVSKVKLGNYEYERAIISDRLDYAYYYAVINGKQIIIELQTANHFKKFPYLQNDFEELISNIKYR
jgi:hypothetical protein